MRRDNIYANVELMAAVEMSDGLKRHIRVVKADIRRDLPEPGDDKAILLNRVEKGFFPEGIEPKYALLLSEWFTIRADFRDSGDADKLTRDLNEFDAKLGGKDAEVDPRLSSAFRFITDCLKSPC